MLGFAHESVLATEVINYLSPRDHGTYVDCTLGGAGHATAILNAARGIRLIGIDRDPAALQHARARLSELTNVRAISASDDAPEKTNVRAISEAQVTVVHGEMRELPSILASMNITQVDGILADLGVSSPQLDQAARGFSFMHEGPLDMRMDPTRGPTALELIRRSDPDALANLIYELGEERYSRKIARAIKDALAEDRIQTTTQLATIVAAAIPAAEARKSKIHPATRTFQALRIAVNGELDQLAALLATFPDLLAPGGRCAIISFHSLEDRMVKQRFRELAWSSSLPPRFAAEQGERIEPVCTPITRKAIVAGEPELARNPRARSARLRVCARTSAPNVPAGAAIGAAIGAPNDRQ
jgi:16S rRNA (cytosine1402-N4)-methyltransferase